MASRPIVYLIDGSSQMYRAFHAPVRTNEGGFLRNAQGRPTNAVYIFVTMLRKLLNEHKPEYIAASFDLPGRTFRDDLVTDYKANRAPMPDELAEQIPMVHDACRALGVPILTSERYEADDVIGTLTEQAAAGKHKRYREGLLANIDNARQSRELARIRTDVPVEFDADALKYRGVADRGRCFQIFTELGFRLFAHEYAPTADSIAKTYRIVNTPEALSELAGRLRAAGRFALRVLPYQPAAMRARTVALASSRTPPDAHA